MIIDSQIHLWSSADTEEEWTEGDILKPHLKEALTWQRFLPMMNEAGVDRALIMPPPWVGNNYSHAIDAVERNPGRFGIVPTVNVSSLTPSHCSEVMGTPHVYAVRAIFTGPNVSLLDGERLEWFWDDIAASRFAIMILAPQALSRLKAIARRHPGLRIIVDHMGLTAQIAKAGKIDEQVEQILTLAECPNIFVKVSSIATYSAEAYPFRDMTLRLRKVIDAFGAHRSFWGTDLTMAFDRASYAQRVTHFRDELGHLTAEEMQLVMGQGLANCLNWTMNYPE